MRLKLLLAIVMMLLSYMNTTAANYVSGSCQSVQVNLFAKPVATDEEPEHDDNTSTKHRLPSCPIPCTIDENGVTFQMDSEPEIINYDIYDAEGVLIASFGDEEAFIQTLFSLSGDYTVAFTTAEYVYTGYVSI